MKKISSCGISLCAFFFLFLSASPATWSQQEKVKESGSPEKETVQEKKPHPAVVPVDRKAPWWQKRHQLKKQGIKANQDLELLFVGDSITHGFEGKGKKVWDQYYKPRKAFNIGYSGDRTEHVLWRFDHGELEGIQPKLAVIMIGTNNTGHRKDPPEMIAAGIQKILQKLKGKCPKTKILLLGIFPRSAKPGNRMRKINFQANQLISKFANEKKGIFFLNINKKFLDKDGVLPKSVMPDLLHPGEAGYQMWAEAIEPKVKELMGE